MSDMYTEDSVAAFENWRLDYMKASGQQEPDRHATWIAARATYEANSERKDKAALLDDAVKALWQAKRLIQAWHGDEGSLQLAWEIYDKASPEMKPINDILARAEALGIKP